MDKKGNLKIKKRHLLKSFLVYFFVLVSTVGILAYFESSYIKVVSTNIEIHEDNILKMQSDNILYELDEIVTDLSYLADVYGQDIINHENIESLESEWMIFSNQKKHYAQIRYLDKLGNEIIRINQIEGQAVLVPQDELQNKKSRTYFSETMKLSEDQVYISEIDLNMENGMVSLPFTPTIRFSTPIFDENNEIQGMIILNYLAENLLSQLDELSTTSNGYVEILNEDGYWISSHDKSQEFAFMFSNRTAINFQIQYPNEWRNILNNQLNVHTKNGHFLMTKVNLDSQMESMDISNNIVMHERNWLLVSYIPNSPDYEYLFSLDQGVFVKHLFTKYVWVLLFVSLLAGLLASLIYSNDQNFSNVQYHSSYDGLTKILNRRAGLKRIEDYLQLSHSKDVWISCCYIDINGLKEVNDRLGHRQGDILIQLVTESILDEIRETDFFMRLGGDEFLLILPKTNFEAAQKVWDRILEKYEMINETHQHPFILSVSHGLISRNIEQVKNIDDFINEADQVMYAEKRMLKKHLKIIRDEFFKL